MTAWDDTVSQPGSWPRSTFVHTAAQIGAGARIGHHVYIGPGVVLGERCRVQSGAVIGEDGFGYEQVDGCWEPKPHPYGVVIGDDVHIGANACIDRGSWRDTTIEQGARIDNGVHVAHNVEIHANAVVVANAMLAGSVVVQQGAWIGPSACVRQRLTIGARALVGMGAVIVKHVPAGTTWAGNPARCLNTEVGVRAAM